MSDPTHAPPEPAQPSPAERDAAWARRLHDHTHEIELLISAALVFGLVQAPGALDAWFDETSVRLVGTTWTVAFVGWYYTKLIVYTLILAFGAHLVARGYWVGLVGLDSVFPDGVDWERMRYGPLTKKVYRGRARPLSTLARGADRFASAIFSLAFLLVYLFVFSVLLAGVVGAVAVGITALVPSWSTEVLWLVLMVVAGGLPTLSTAVDKLADGRIEEDGVLGRTICRVLGGFWTASGGALFLPIQFVLFTRVPKKVIWPLYTGLFVLLMGLFIGGELVRSGSLVVSSNELFPSRPGVRSVDTRYFASTRDSDSPAPFIQSEVVTGPYLRLELPLVARRDRDRMEAACDGEPALGEEGFVRTSVLDEPASPEATDQVLACLATLWEVRLDGRLLEVEWDFRSVPGEGVTGLVTYLPTSGMEPGAHVLEIEEVHVDIPGGGEDGESTDEETEARAAEEEEAGASVEEEGAEAADEEGHRHRLHIILFRS